MTHPRGSLKQHLPPVSYGRRRATGLVTPISQSINQFSLLRTRQHNRTQRNERI